MIVLFFCPVYWSFIQDLFLRIPCLNSKLKTLNGSCYDGLQYITLGTLLDGDEK